MLGALSAKLNGSPHKDIVRYEVGLAYISELNLVEFTHERVLLRSDEAAAGGAARAEFPSAHAAPGSIFLPTGRAFQSVVAKVGAVDWLSSETAKRAPGDSSTIGSFSLGPRKSALAYLPPDENKFPVATWLHELLKADLRPLQLDSALLRQPSRPGLGRGFRTDGANLPWVVDSLIKEAPARYSAWIAHLRTALPDLAGIRVVEREDDRHKYLMLRHDSGLEVPSWLASDGTLRLLALTLPAYLPDFGGIYLIEEPENGIHPRAIETLCQSLSSAYDAQILVATHSPIILSLVQPEQVLCFAKTEEGQTDIVRGDDHPALRDWRRESDLGMLLAAGVLG